MYDKFLYALAYIYISYSIMQNLHLKHVTQLIKLELPNINVMSDDDSINKLFFVYVYKKNIHDDNFPTLFPQYTQYSGSTVRICGEINLENYPAASPQSIIYGDIPHCHVYKINDMRYKVCHSLDRSFEWYFKNNQTSTFNPSMTLIHYVISMYKFLAEDDETHVINNERYIKSLEYWSEYQFTQSFPKTELFYEDATKLLNDLLYGTNLEHNGIELPTNSNLSSIDFADRIDYIDYIDKKSLLNVHNCSILPIFHDVKRLKHHVSVKVLNFTKKIYYDSGIRKTSQGYVFTNCLPAVINSSLWTKEYFFKIFDDEIIKMYSDRMNNLIITSLSKSKEECYIYSLFEIINEILISITSDENIQDYKFKLLLCIYHNLLYINSCVNTYLDQIVSYCELNQNFTETIVPNLIVVIGILLYQKRDIPYYIIEEIFYRITHRCMYNIINAKKYVHIDDNIFVINDIYGWKSFMWENSYKYLQSIALFKLFFIYVKNISLEDMDASIAISKLNDDAVKKIILWKNLEGINGFNEFTKFMGVDMDVVKLINKSFNKFNENSIMTNIVDKWIYTGSYYGTYYCSFNYPSDIM